jgi:hypothetical protein
MAVAYSSRTNVANDNLEYLGAYPYPQVALALPRASPGVRLPSIRPYK